MAFKNVGIQKAGVFTVQGGGAPMGGIPMMDAAGVASGGAFLESELEKRDPMIRTPLTSFTYPRDIVIKSGGGWVDYVSAMSVAYGMTGGSGSGPVNAGGANGIPVVQASVDKGLYKAHVFAAALRIMFVDMQRANFIGRSIEQMLTDGLRMTYDKHMDQNVYIGIEDYGTTGIANDPDVVETTVDDGEAGTSDWASKTPDEILADINTAITETWASAEYDEAAVPNHILIPYEQYTSIINRKVSDLGNVSIMTYLMQNNIVNQRGGSLFIGATRYCKGRGTGATDRMVVYSNHEKYLKMDELVPLTRIMSQPNATEVCYDTAYMANISQAQLIYPQCITYWDGI